MGLQTEKCRRRDGSLPQVCPLLHRKRCADPGRLLLGSRRIAAGWLRVATGWLRVTRRGSVSRPATTPAPVVRGVAGFDARNELLELIGVGTVLSQMTRFIAAMAQDDVDGTHPRSRAICAGREGGYHARTIARLEM